MTKSIIDWWGYRVYYCVTSTLLLLLMYSTITQEMIAPHVTAGLSVRKIAIALNVCQQTVIRALRRFGLKTIVPKAHPDLDIEYFKIIDTKEKAYWLGFLYADGCVKQGKDSPNGSMSLAFELAIKDEDCIDRFCEAVKANKTKKSYCTRLGKYHAVSIRIYGEFVRYLATQGCTPNKTFRMTFPWFGQRDLDLAFLLGFYDGDGTGAGALTCGNLAFLRDIARRYGIEDKLKVKGNLGSLYLPASLKKEMFANYANSMARKRITSKHISVFQRTGVRFKPPEKIVWPSNEELAKLVWSKPMNALAIEFGLQSNSIKRRCILRGIPRPPRAYWTRRSLGYTHEEALVCQTKPRTGQKCLPKLTPDQVREVRKLILEGEISLRKIAKMFGCSRHTIMDIRDGTTYKSVF